MSSTDSAVSMSERYARAVRFTPPKCASQTPAVAVEGYWLDDSGYYFLAERFEPSLGRVVAIPSIADCNVNSVDEVIGLSSLADILSGYSARPLDLEALSTAEFDLRDRDTLAVSTDGQDYLVDPRRRCVIEARASLAMPALYSPDGRYACFVRGHDLWLKQRDNGAERPLTSDGEALNCYGQQSETSLSAVSYRRRPRPVGLWSPDSQWFLTQRIDERSLPELALIENVPPERGRPVLHRYKYPIPGDPLPVATYVAIHIPSGRVVMFDDVPVPITSFSPFTVRAAWFGKTDTVWLVRLDRYCKQADLITLDLRKGTGRVVLSETAASGYLDLNPLLIGTPNIRTLTGSDELIWFSERDGWGHLYLYDATAGRLKNRITSGEWLVRDIVHVDEERRKVLFLGGGIDRNADPARRSLCAVNLDGTGFEVLLAHEGDTYVAVTEPCGFDQNRPFRPSNVAAGISPSGRFGVARYASIERGNVTEIVELSTQRGFAIAAMQPTIADRVPRHFTSLAADGVTPVHGVMFFPSDFDENQRYPLIDDIYPGPQVAQQPQSFGSVHAAQARALAELGFVTIMLDTRGTPVGSRAFHQAGYGALLEPQLADHAAVVRELCKRHSFIDGERIGIIGQSGGGAATARALFDYGDLFKVGVAACGNHVSSLYAAVWSDKYRGPDPRDACVEPAHSALAHKLKGKLLLISGDMDENVHVSQTLILVDAMIRANREFDLLIVPNAGHSVLLTHGYTVRRAWDYFVRHLRGEEPPKEFEVRFEPYEVERFLRRYLQEIRQ